LTSNNTDITTVADSTSAYKEGDIAAIPRGSIPCAENNTA
jgi:hypothetical protein